VCHNGIEKKLSSIDDARKYLIKKNLVGDKLKITIVYDNEISKTNKALKADWGFACVIDTEEDTVLFDTGAKGDILLGNMKILGLDPGRIDAIVLSHEHWDHTGGLDGLRPFLHHVRLYRLASKQHNENLINVDSEESQRITKNVYTTGRLSGSVDEQSLILHGKKGSVVLVGCSHPGVGKILTAAKEYGTIIGLIGGFHGFDDFRVIEDLDFICPCHCTARKKQLQKAFPEKYSPCGVGKMIDTDMVV
jgi:7,8-dihydropterin-6-yl-methyl-4-(beta-D-ribofuranosyl)aminobenzene 5'-phosphate synthase